MPANIVFVNSVFSKWTAFPAVHFPRVCEMWSGFGVVFISAN